MCVCIFYCLPSLYTISHAHFNSSPFNACVSLHSLMDGWMDGWRYMVFVRIFIIYTCANSHRTPLQYLQCLHFTLSLQCQMINYDWQQKKEERKFEIQNYSFPPIDIFSFSVGLSNQYLKFRFFFDETMNKHMFIVIS